MRLNRIHSGHILGLAGLLAPIAGVFAPLLVTPVALFAILGQLALHAFRGSGFRSDRSLVTVFAWILVWCVISLIWTIDHEDALTKCASVVVFGVLAGATLIFSPPMVEHERHTLRRFILAGIALGFAFFLFEIATDGVISRNLLGKVPFKDATVTLFNLTSSVLFLFVWPAVAILWRSWPPAAVGVIALSFFAAFILPSASAMIGFSVGAVFFFLSLLAKRGACLFFAIALTVAILAPPLIPAIAPVLDPGTIRANAKTNNASFLHRLDIWKFTLQKIEERPFQGWGFNASRSIPGGNERYQLKIRSGRIIGQGDRLPLHPHNGALQVWLELGLPGALGFAALFALATLRTVRQTDQAGAAAALAAIATAAPIWFLSFGIWQTWWLSVLVLTTLLIVALNSPSRA